MRKTYKRDDRGRRGREGNVITEQRRGRGGRGRKEH